MSRQTAAPGRGGLDRAGPAGAAVLRSVLTRPLAELCPPPACLSPRWALSFVCCPKRGSHTCCMIGVCPDELVVRGRAGGGWAGHPLNWPRRLASHCSAWGMWQSQLIAGQAWAGRVLCGHSGPAQPTGHSCLLSSQEQGSQMSPLPTASPGIRLEPLLG